MQQDCGMPLSPTRDQADNQHFEEDDQEMQNMKELGDHNSNICEEDEDDEDAYSREPATGPTPVKSNENSQIDK